MFLVNKHMSVSLCEFDATDNTLAKEYEAGLQNTNLNNEIIFFIFSGLFKKLFLYLISFFKPTKVSEIKLIENC